MISLLQTADAVVVAEQTRMGLWQLFMSVVAISMNSSNRKIRSVIEADENDLSTLDPRLIAITDYF